MYFPLTFRVRRFVTLREHVDLSYPLLTDTLPCFTPEPPQYETKTFCGSGPKVDEAKSVFSESEESHRWAYSA